MEKEELIFDSMSADDRAKAEDVIRKYHAAKDSTQTLRQTNWPKFYKTYIQEHDTAVKYSYRSRIYIPLVFSRIRVLVPYIMQTIFSSDPAFKLKDCTGMKSEEKQAIEKVIEVQNEKNDLYSRLKTFVLNMAIYGTAVGKVYWERDVEPEVKTRSVKKLKYAEIGGVSIPVGWQTVEENYSENRVNFDGPVFAPIDLNDFYIDPKADKLDGFWKIHIVKKTIKDLVAANRKKGDRIYKNLNMLRIAAANSSGSSEEERLKDDRKQPQGVNVDSGRLPTKQITLAEYWSADGKTMRVVALDYGILIRETKNPFDHGRSPFVFARYMEVPGQFYGMGIPEIIYGLQQNVNTITNQRNDNLNIILNRMWKVKRDGGVNLDTLKSAPGNVIMVDEMDEVEPFETPDVTQSAYIEVARNKEEAEEATGTRYISGAAPMGSNKTATGTRLNQQAELTSVQGIFTELEATCLKPYVYMVKELNKQFNDTDTVVEIIGPRGRAIEFTVSPAEYKKDYNFYAAGIRNVLQKDVQVHQMTNFLAIIGRMPPDMILAYGINIPEILKRIWESMGLDDPNMIIAGPEQTQGVAQEAAQYGMMNQMSQSLGQGMASNMVDTSNPANTLQAGNQAGGQQGARIQ